MQLAEFAALWVGNYTPEQEQTYSITCGDDRSAWPPTNDIAPVTIDLDRVCRFNPHHEEDKTTVELAGGLSFALVVPYLRFKDIMVFNGHYIIDYKNEG